MSMLEQFLSSLFTKKFMDTLDVLIDSFVADHSQWVYTDGEEGYYRVITYTHLGFVVCKYTDSGGGGGDYEFTEIGNRIITSAIIAAMSQRLVNMEI